MKTLFAFVGFRHSHIFDLLAGVRERKDCEIVACCEEDEATREELSSGDKVEITHTNFRQMLSEVDCEVVCVGDYYSRRGELTIAALRAGKHVLSDKPLCTNLGEHAQIEDIARRAGLSVGLQFDLRGAGPFIKLREIIQSGEIGEVRTVRIEGQHPLLLGKRPAWYFEPGKHGGTLNDIGIHAFDFVPWLTGQNWKDVVAARSWNVKADEFPHFKDGSQLMATLDNGAGVLADFSYLAPDKAGYQMLHYWHVTIHGTKGLAQTNLNAATVGVVLDHYEGMDQRPVAPAIQRRYLEDFINEIRGQRENCDLTSEDCLRASRLAIEAQRKSVG